MCQSYRGFVVAMLPAMPMTQTIQDVEAFIREKKSPEYFVSERSVSNADDLSTGQARPYPDR